MESLESDTDEERASLLSILSKVHYIIQKYIRKKKKRKNNKINLFNEIHKFLIISAYLI